MNPDPNAPVHGLDVPIAMLFVEDNETDALIIQSELESDPQLDVRITHVVCLADALACCQSRRFDIVLADLNLPDSQGVSTFDRLLAAAHDIPLIVVSGLEDTDLSARVLSAGAQDYITKRQAAERVLSHAIRHAIDRQHFRIESQHHLQQLRESENRFRRIIESNADAVLIVDASGFVRFFNPAAERMFGRRAKTMLGDPFGFPIAGPGEGSASLLDFIHADGSPGVAEMRTAEIQFEGQAAYLASLRDITKHVHTEVELRDALTRLRAVVADAPICLWALDATGNITLSEGNLLEKLKLEPAELVGQSFLELYRDQPLMTGMTNRALQGESFQEQVEIGGLVMQTWYTPSVDEDGRLTGTIGVGFDVTERVRLEEQFRQAQKMEAVGRLAGGIAHDFNNLLTVISSFASLAAEQLGTMPAVRQDVEQIQQAAESAARLTGQLLSFSRRQIVQPKILDLNQEIDRLQSLLRRMIGEDIAISTRLSRQLKKVRIDPGQIEQIIFNLATNARDAMPAGGQFTIETSNVEIDDSYTAGHAGISNGSYVMMALSDTGVGMDEKLRQSAFEPFFTTKEPGKGTGLGLATVYGIAKQNGGAVWLYSEPGKGATFKIYLPVASTEQTGEAEGEERAIDLSGSETILVVDDQAGVRAAAKRILEREGYQVFEAENGPRALEICRNADSHVDLVLTDVVLTCMSGRQLAEQLHSEHPALRTLYMSGYTDDTVVRHGIIESAVAFVQKPFTRIALLQKVREALNAPTAPAPPPEGKTQRILFLDDESALAQLASRLLTRRQYAVSTFTNQDEAVEAFRTNPRQFDWVVTDLNMPGASGLDVARQLLSIRQDIPIILCSGAVTDLLKETARRAGIRHVVFKALDMSEFCDTLHHHFSRTQPQPSDSQNSVEEPTA